MSEAIMVVLITTAGSLLGTFAGVVVSSRLTAYRIEKLEEKVNKHNNLVERMTLVENKATRAHLRIDRMKEREIDREISNQLARLHRRTLRRSRRKTTE